MNEEIYQMNRDVTGNDLEWLHNGPNPERMAELAQAEIEEALSASSTPRHWRPIEVDEQHMR